MPTFTRAFRLGLALLVAWATAVAAQDRPRPGLMWSRSDLPRVFPLILKTVPGSDVYVTLTPVGAAEPVMAAYARGGVFFRVLVPPGVFDLAFAAGERWRGETALFGPGEATRRFALDEPLDFEVRGLGTKAGHVVDLTGAAPGVLADAAPGIVDFGLCQTVRQRLPEPRIGGEPDDDDWEDLPLRDRYGLGFEVRSVVCG
jgi:hypothetical protein